VKPVQTRTGTEKEIEMNKKITAVVGGLALGLLVLAPAAAQAESSVSVSLSGNTLQVVGDDSSDSISVADQNDPACPGGSPCYEIQSVGSVVVPSAPCVVADSSGGNQRALCPASDLSRLIAFGRNGDDTIVISDFVFGLSLHADLRGGLGDDSFQGSAGADTISGNEGNDTIRSRDGNDLVLGNSGKDRVYGSKGSDTIVGGPGFDNLIGGLGNDRLFGNAGNDGMDGAQGRDYCDGGKGRDAPRHCEKVSSAP
jgi:Ca2+-binding RTX toxin-like protein